MADTAPENAPSPQVQDDQNEQDDEDEEQIDGEDDATLSQASPRPSRSGTPRRGGRTVGLLRGRKRGLGRSRRSQQVETEEEVNEPTSDAGTPKRRGGFRGRSRWMKNKAGQSRQQAPPVDDGGNAMEVVDDQVVLPSNPEGDKKVDENGRLQGGREYRVRTFELLGRGQRLYMLSTEPARCIGFRDSYLLFQKHKYLYKILLDEDEKLDLVARDIIPHSYKGRSIGVVTARSIYREFGAAIIVAGKKVTDDYDEETAKANGAVEGELAAPGDPVPLYGQGYNRNQYVAWHGASAVYHTNLPNVPLQGGKIEGKSKKRERVSITSDNWMFEHAREASRFNSTLSKVRQRNTNGVYDIHTNSMHWPNNLQSTHARWQKVGAQDEAMADMAQKLPPLKPVYARNFRIHDFCLESAPDSSLGLPGHDNDEVSLGAIPPSVMAELPDDCLEALQSAQSREVAWRSQWTTEKSDGMRAHFLPSIEWYPK